MRICYLEAFKKTLDTLEANGFTKPEVETDEDISAKNKRRCKMMFDSFAQSAFV